MKIFKVDFTCVPECCESETKSAFDDRCFITFFTGKDCGYKEFHEFVSSFESKTKLNLNVVDVSPIVREAAKFNENHQILKIDESKLISVIESDIAASLGDDNRVKTVDELIKEISIRLDDGVSLDIQVKNESNGIRFTAQLVNSSHGELIPIYRFLENETIEYKAESGASLADALCGLLAIIRGARQ